MKKILTLIAILPLILLTACSSPEPMTEAEQAEHYGITVERFRDEKKAAARMNMNLEEHMKMLEGDHDMNSMNHN